MRTDGPSGGLSKAITPVSCRRPNAHRWQTIHSDVVCELCKQWGWAVPGSLSNAAFELYVMKSLRSHRSVYRSFVAMIGGSLKWGYPPNFSINHPFWGSPIYGNPHVFPYILSYIFPCFPYDPLPRQPTTAQLPPAPGCLSPSHAVIVTRLPRRGHRRQEVYDLRKSYGQGEPFWW